MIFLILILALAFVFFLWKINELSRRANDFEERINLLRQQLAKLAQQLENLSGKTKPLHETAPVETSLSQPAHVEGQPVAETIVPPLPPKPEPKPVPLSEAIRPIARPPETRTHPPAISPPSWKLPRFDWESIVGVKLFSWIAGVALLLAAVFFLRYSINQGWLMPPVRMAIGIFIGVGLLILCELKAARKYPITANAMDASAIAILFSTFFAARVLWNLIGVFPAFGLMVLVTAIAVLLSIRRDSVFIALLGMLGGFATPALLSSGENKPISLFTYILILNAGLAWVAAKKKWPLLITISLVFTVIYQWGWVIRFLTAPQLPLAFGIFLIFPVMAFAALIAGLKEEPGKGWVSLYGQTANLTTLLPLLFALYTAAIPGYGHRYVLLFGFLFLLDAGFFAIAAARRQELMHLTGGLSTILVFAIWLKSSYESSAWPSILGLAVLFSTFYLAAPFIARRFRRGFIDMGRRAIYAVPLLLFVIPYLAAVEPACAAPGLLFMTFFLIMLGASVYAIWAEEEFIYLIAVVFAFLSEAVWSLKYLTPERVLPALAIYTVFSLFFISVPIAARRWQKKLQPNYIFLGLTGHIFLMAIAAHRPLTISPWPFLAAIFILDVAIGFAALYLRRNDIHLAATTISTLILMLWVGVANIAPWPSVGILAAGALCLLSVLLPYFAKKAGNSTLPFFNTAATAILLSQLVATVASVTRGSPSVGFLLATHLVFLISLLCLEWIRGSHSYAVVAVLTTAIAVSFWCIGHSESEFWPQQLLFAAPIYLVFIAYPLLLGRCAGSALAPYLAPVLAGIPFFFQARHAILKAGWGDAIGILPVIQALLMGLLLMRLHRIETPGKRSLGRLALVAGAGLAFITVAIPLQLEKEWVTIGWAFESTALVWLYGRISHKGLLYAASGLFAAVFARLALNPFIFSYQPRSGLRIWNWYLYTYLVSAASMMFGGWLISKNREIRSQGWSVLSKLFPAGGTVLLFWLLNIEIADFYSTGPTITFNFTAGLAQDLTYTLGWALFAVGLLAVGIALNNQMARIAALSLLVITIFKCFIHDLARLGGLYLVASLFGLALCLALVALALQKFVLSARKQENKVSTAGNTGLN
jgi:hypothetical protein